jgi:hypothetical protein
MPSVPIICDSISDTEMKPLWHRLNEYTLHMCACVCVCHRKREREKEWASEGVCVCVALCPCLCTTDLAWYLHPARIALPEDLLHCFLPLKVRVSEVGSVLVCRQELHVDAHHHHLDEAPGAQARCAPDQKQPQWLSLGIVCVFVRGRGRLRRGAQFGRGSVLYTPTVCDTFSRKWLKKCTISVKVAPV